MKSSITLQNIRNDNDLRRECATLYKNIDSLREFGNYSNHKVFMYVFGKEEGMRLWKCFVKDTNRNIYNLFFTYMTREQQFVLAANILKNEDIQIATVRP